MTGTRTEAVAATLTEHVGVHEQWTSDYRTTENERFFERAFDRIVEVLQPGASSTILDAGCGCGRHSQRLANRNFEVTAVDFSESMLEKARQRLAGRDNVHFQREDLTSLSFPTETFDYVMSWGVLMHIVEVEKAVSELARVLKPGGRFVTSEANMYSVQGQSFEWARRLLNKGDAAKERTDVGMEYWTETESGKLLTRECDMRGFVKMAGRYGLTLERRFAGQFTEAYTRVSSAPIRKMIHLWNRVWFDHIRWAGPAFGNILIFRCNDSRS